MDRQQNDGTKNITSLTLKVLATSIDALGHFKQDNYSTVGGDGGGRVGEVRAGSTSPPPHLDLSRCPLLHKSLQPPVLRTVRVVIQPESSG